MRAAAAIVLCGLTALVLPARARDTDGVLEGGGGLNCSARLDESSRLSDRTSPACEFRPRGAASGSRHYSGELVGSARIELLRRRQHPPDQPHRPGVDQPQPPVVDGIKPSTRMTLQPQSS